ncbi:MAG: regulatory iron-sulfur-containing complex subunit RicT [Patescibacteria group bacterium]
MNLGIKNFYDDAVFVTSADNDLNLQLGDKIIFEQKEVEHFGEIVFLDRKKLAADEILLEGKILRKVNKKDLAKIETQAAEAAESLEKARAKVAELDLKMQITEARLDFAGSELNFFFTTGERVEFKDVVPRLAGVMQKRIHLTQLGMRDRAKACGGFGICGREQCCSSGVLGKFRSITMEMVKTQELAMKGAEKLSGPCGKLLCCLAYELEEYERARKKMPTWGARVKTEKGEGKVIALDILNQNVKVYLEKGGAQVFPADSVKVVK